MLHLKSLLDDCVRRAFRRLTLLSVLVPACGRCGKRTVLALSAAAVLAGGVHAAQSVGSQAATPSQAASPATLPVQDMDVARWVARLRGNGCSRSYVGTFVVISANGAMSSSRIAQACDGEKQVERVEALSGVPRTVYRRNGEVRTFLTQPRTVRTDRSDASGLFPQPPLVPGAKLSDFYEVQRLGVDRVAGRGADVFLFRPKDDLRLGYRIWADQQTGLLVKLQTLSATSTVVEQAAFSEIDWNASVSVDDLSRGMDATEGYQVISAQVLKTTAQAEGWGLRQAVDGFVPVQCYRRSLNPRAQGSSSVLQCLYSDGLASVSLFLEPLDPARHGNIKVQEVSMGATQLLARRASDDTWLTIVGEVPRKTLHLFSNYWERLR